MLNLHSSLELLLPLLLADEHTSPESWFPPVAQLESPGWLLAQCHTLWKLLERPARWAWVKSLGYFLLLPSHPHSSPHFALRTAIPRPEHSSLGFRSTNLKQNSKSAPCHLCCASLNIPALLCGLWAHKELWAKVTGPLMRIQPQVSHVFRVSLEVEIHDQT